MKHEISIITDEISPDLEECKAFLDEQRLSAVELRCIGEGRIPDISATDLATLKRWSDAGEIRVTAASPGIFKCNLDDRGEARKQLSETLPRTIEIASRLGASFIITFSFNNPGRHPVQSYSIDFFRKASEACEIAGLKLLVENEPGFLAETAEDTLELVKAVDHPSFGINWDPANSNRFTEEELSAGLEKIFPLVRNIHVKNARKTEGRLFPKYCSLLDGEINWQAHLALLDRLNYSGYLCVETHFEPVRKNSLVVLNELRDILAKIDSSGA